MDLFPVLTMPCPFLCDVHHRQIQHFQQTVVSRENGFGFCHLAQLAVKAFNGVGRINQASDCFRIFEIGGQSCPIIML